MNKTKFYSRGEVYGEHRIRLGRILRIDLCTQKNIAGTYTKTIRLPGFCFVRCYMGCTLKILGIRFL